LEERFFEVLNDDDHPWHEFLRVAATDAATFDLEPEHKRDIAEFLVELDNAHHTGWDEIDVREDLVRQLTEQKRTLKQRLASKWGGY
jgi:hypothetical protein